MGEISIVIGYEPTYKSQCVAADKILKIICRWRNCSCENCKLKSVMAESYSRFASLSQTASAQIEYIQPRSE